MNSELLEKMMQMITGNLVSQSISTAAELGIADRLAGQPLSAEELAKASGVKADKLFRLLRFLASLDVFKQGEDGRWSLTPLAELLRSDVPGSLRAGARMMGRMSAAFPRLTENIRTGECAYQLAFGKPVFEDLAGKPEDAAIFDEAMCSFHGGETEAVLDVYNYDDIPVLGDIGCGNGAVMIATLQRYPEMRGILYDRGHVMERTAERVHKAGLADRCTLERGSFFDSVPAGADAYTMRHIIHDWPDEESIHILRNIRQVIPDHGRLMVIETVVPDGNDPSPSKLFDMMMMLCPNGMERTEEQFRAIFEAAGFELTGITSTESPVAVVEGRPV